MNRLDIVENTQVKDSVPAFQPGDTLRVHVRIKEGNKERLQAFEGICIARKERDTRAKKQQAT
jgi:large subunit ribosomal protein L19